MTARTTYEGSVTSTGAVKSAALAVNESAKQATIAAQSSAIGYQPGFSITSSAALEAATRAANTAKFNADFAAEQAKQAALAVARDTLRTAGDLAPF